MTPLREHSADTVRRAAKSAMIHLDSVVPPPADGVVVLAYHRVGQRTTSAVDLPSGLFAEQMWHVAARRDVLTIDAAADALADPKVGGRLEGHPVVMTFDDGTADFIDEVLPILVDLQLPATLYVATAFIDGQKSFPNDGKPLTWNALRECVSTGLVTIGAHTHTHQLLDRADEQSIDLELDISNARIEAELGISPSHFAYPKAVGGSGYADLAIRRRYRTAALAGTRPNRIGNTDLWRLSRSPIQAADDWAGFMLKVSGRMRLEDDLRRAANRLRYRGRTT